MTNQRPWAARFRRASAWPVLMLGVATGLLACGRNAESTDAGAAAVLPTSAAGTVTPPSSTPASAAPPSDYASAPAASAASGGTLSTLSGAPRSAPAADGTATTPGTATATALPAPPPSVNPSTSPTAQLEQPIARPLTAGVPSSTPGPAGLAVIRPSNGQSVTENPNALSVSPGTPVAGGQSASNAGASVSPNGR